MYASLLYEVYFIYFYIYRKILYDSDEGVDRHFSVLLSKVDVRKAPWGLYNFYRLQVITMYDELWFEK